jgi:hypothetical protein
LTRFFNYLSLKLNQKFFTVAAALSAIVAPAHATITLSFQAQELLQGGVGTNPAPGGSLVLLVADTTGGGFGNLSQGAITVGSIISHTSNDLIVGQFSLTPASPFTQNEPVLNASGPFTLSGGWAAGDPLAIYWIPSLTSANTTVGGGVAYGEYTDPTGLHGSAAWITPSNGSTANTMLFSTSGVFGTGNVAASTGYASKLTTSAAVPEPSTFALLGGAMGLTAAALRRRKKSLAAVV